MHACIRCPMLRPDPKQLGRLSEIIEKLDAAWPRPATKGAGRGRGTRSQLDAAHQIRVHEHAPSGSTVPATDEFTVPVRAVATSFGALKDENWRRCPPGYVRRTAATHCDGAISSYAVSGNHRLRVTS